MPRSRPLTEREAQVLVLMDRGLSTRDIAARLGIGRHAVNLYAQRAAYKFGVPQIGEALALYREQQNTPENQ